jgi:hypothetical protein
LRENRLISSRHVLEVLGHPKCQVVLIHDLLVGLLQLQELLHQLVVAKDGIGVVRGVVDDSAELRRGGADGETEQK